MRLVVLLTTLFLSLKTFSQKGKIEGRVTDAVSSQPITGVSVLLNKSNSGVATDLEGKFTLTLDAGKKYTITLSSVGYQTKEVIDVEVASGAATTLDILLQSLAKSGSEIVIKGSARKESAAALISYQKNAPTVASVMSAEAIRRSPDRNTGEVLKRVPGASVQEGKYLVVRGLADRYNQAMLNGILLSSTEPDRKTFSFDLFPSAMIENIIMNKAFIPELPGEWAGGLVQVQTRDIPAADFFNVHIGTGFNSQTIGKDFYQYKGGKLDWLGIEVGARDLPVNIPGKAKFSQLDQVQQNEFGKRFRNVWQATPGNAPLNSSFQVNGGFSGKLFGKKIGGVLAVTYNQSNRRLQFDNQIVSNKDGDIDLAYKNNRYSRDVLAGVLGNFTIQFDNNNKISFKNILNVNSSDFVVDRYAGTDNTGIIGNVKAQELSFRQNTFFNTQLLGEHNLSGIATRLKWYGGFNILDQYIPDQKRLFYTQDLSDLSAPFYALLGLGASQKSGSIFYSNLSDYIYNAGGDVSKNFQMFGRRQSMKAGYLFQVKDRLFNSRPFFVNTSSNFIKQLPADKIFAPENFGTGPDKVQFAELTGDAYRYMANSILNAAFLQFDNQFTTKLRATWGVRLEHFDQLIGSVKISDRRHVHSKVLDWLPGVNLTYKLSDKENIRLSGSQTIVRPEFRELSNFAFYDFELNAQVAGNSGLRRTKVTNSDLRYEVYPRAGELITVAGFYKQFQDPLEYYFNQTGPATNTYNVQNSDKAVAYGAEVEFRKKLDFISHSGKTFTLTGNFSYIYSKVEDTVAMDRPLQGQSPYLMNLGLQYDIEPVGFTSTVLFNQVGRRILFVGNEAVPNIWENPRPILDFQLTKKLLKKKAELKLNVSDILNKKAYFYHDLDESESYKSSSKDKLAIVRNYGTNFSLTFSYSIK
jgi:hypothetical protein